MSAPAPDLLAVLLDGAGVGVAVMDGDGRFRQVNDRMAEINGRPAEEHVGRHYGEILPELEDVLRPWIERVVATREPVSTVVAGDTAASRGRRWQVSYLPVDTGDGPGVGVVLMDVSAREEAVREARRRLRQQAALADLGQQALAATDLEGLLFAATDLLARELESRFAGVLVLEDGATDLVMRAGTGFPDEAMGTMRAGLGPTSQAGYTLASGGPVVTGDAPGEQRFVFTRPLLDLGVRSAISVPIPGVGGPFGVLGVLSVRADHFDEDDAALVRGVATVIGGAVVRIAQQAELADLAAQRGALAAETLDAAERERSEVAAVLQDEALQHLLFARLELSSLHGDEAARRRVDASLEAAAGLLRRVVGGLHPVTLEHAGLAAALGGLEVDGVRVEADVDPGAEGVRDRLLLSLAEELVRHAASRGGASRAEVEVSRRNGTVVLRVAADGAAVPPDAFQASRAIGDVALATVRERVAAVDGTIEVEPSGVVIRLPC